MLLDLQWRRSTLLREAAKGRRWNDSNTVTTLDTDSGMISDPKDHRSILKKRILKMPLPQRGHSVLIHAGHNGGGR